MKQSDAAWFSGHAAPSSAGGPSLSGRVQRRADAEALIQHLTFRRPPPSHMRFARGSPSPVGSEFSRAPLFQPGFAAATKPAGPASVGFHAEVSGYSGLSLHPPLPRLTFSLHCLPLQPFLLCNMWKLLGGGDKTAVSRDETHWKHMRTLVRLGTGLSGYFGVAFFPSDVTLRVSQELG